MRTAGTEFSHNRERGRPAPILLCRDLQIRAEVHYQVGVAQPLKPTPMHQQRNTAEHDVRHTTCVRSDDDVSMWRDAGAAHLEHLDLLLQVVDVPLATHHPFRFFFLDGDGQPTPAVSHAKHQSRSSAQSLQQE